MGVKIAIEKDGIENEYEIIDILAINEQQYVVYSDGEADDNGDPILCMSKLIDTNEMLEIQEIDDYEYENVIEELKKRLSEGDNNG